MAAAYEASHGRRLMIETSGLRRTFTSRTLDLPYRFQASSAIYVPLYVE